MLRFDSGSLPVDWSDMVADLAVDIDAARPIAAADLADPLRAGQAAFGRPIAVEEHLVADIDGCNGPEEHYLANCLFVERENGIKFVGKVWSAFFLSFSP